MKRRFSSHTTLIELTAALLFFMLASVTILGLFTTAYRQSRSARQNTQALQLARDCTAVISGAGQLPEALTDMGYVKQENGVYMLDAQDGLTISVALKDEQTEVGTLLTAEVRVSGMEGTLVELPVSRYYNKEVIHP